ncbi:hypothetical protein [Phytohalomonas tamaricis]|uniref:hypothetical protein n=1 Tax=Phytohalomonas tamaricis TaxID=2081032 RepID=UPI000D0AEEDD|nr:hypothetical protein [Phytohalomonas tamaricis]
MSQANFNLSQFRFEKIEATGISFENSEPKDIELRFVISFDDETPCGGVFSVTINLTLIKLDGEERDEILKVAARGVYNFEEGITPYSPSDHLERAFAVSLLYGCMRPTLDMLTDSIGMAALSLPLTLPVAVTQETPSPSPAE